MWPRRREASPPPPSISPLDSRRTLVVIVNPHATTVSPRLRSLVLHALRACYKVEVADTAYRGHATELARAAAAERPDAVVALGGDGTLNEVANGLAGTGVPMAVLPGGNANVYCRMLNVPGDLIDATELLLAHAERWPLWQADLGRVGDRRFLFAAGIGLDANVVKRVDAHPHRKTWFRDGFYAGAAISTFMAHYLRHPPRMIVSTDLDGESTLDGFSVFIQNGAAYTYLKTRPIELVRGSSLDSGDVSAVILQTHSLLQVPTIAARVLSRERPVESHPKVASLAKRQRLTVASSDGRPLPLQVDGDHIGEATEIEIAIEPNALTLLA